jgi:sialic acid synthase SpsE
MKTLGNTLYVNHGLYLKEALKSVNYAKEAGFNNIKFDLANTIRKPHRDFTVFLMTARKNLSE